jgi:hypothetical protein
VLAGGAGAAVVAGSLGMWSLGAAADPVPDEVRDETYTVQVDGATCSVNIHAQRVGTEVSGRTQVDGPPRPCGDAGDATVVVEFRTPGGETVEAASFGTGGSAFVHAVGAADLIRSRHSVTIIDRSLSYRMEAK